MPPDFSTYTYVLVDPKGQRVKIGTAPDVARKYNSLRAVCNFNVDLFCALPGDRVAQIVGAFQDRAQFDGWFEDRTGEIRQQLAAALRLDELAVTRASAECYADPWEPLVRDALDAVATTDARGQRVAEARAIYARCGMHAVNDRVRVGRILRALGWRAGKTRRSATTADGAVVAVWTRPAAGDAGSDATIASADGPTVADR